jgi:peptidoglycan/xylan/chitin deacetylase (PgdA/CDA1 family)
MARCGGEAVSLRTAAARGVTRVLGLGVFEHAAVARSADRLRILAYHRVPDGDAFAAQLRHLREHYSLVSGGQVADALAGGGTLPARSVWVTFDDGDPSVVEVGLPALEVARVPATVFVCPGLVRDGTPPWWRVVEAAGAAGVGAAVAGQHHSGRSLVRALKQVPDGERRRVLSELGASAGHGIEPDLPWALGEGDLRRWLDAGLEVGNHTWDHPCLDRCESEEQRRQLVDAHEWLVALLGRHPRLFAYPNGDHTAHAEAVLAELGYEVGLLFDHHLADLAQHRLRLSRLRLDSDDALPRCRAVVSGLHSRVLGAVG